jgi:formylglycine-generating enzyme required for sulfatase activity
MASTLRASLVVAGSAAAAALIAWWALEEPACTAGLVTTVAGEDRCLEPGVRFRDHPAAPEMVVVPAGTFPAGSPVDGQDRPEDAPPLHEVTIARAFAAGLHEITYAQWDLCAADGPCAGDKPSDHGWARERKPIIDLTEREVSGYLDWLSGLTGVRYRLLTEAEWEYAARSGSPRDFGLEFLHGMAWEWVSRCRLPTARPGEAPEAGICLRRVQRAATWSEAVRTDTSEPISRAFAGFRAARSIGE